MCHFLLDSIVLMRNLFLFKLVFPYRQYIVSLLLSRIFLSLSLVFRSLSMMCLGVNFIWFILLGVCSASWIYNFMCFAKFGKFLFLQLLFQSHVLSSVLGLQWYEWWILLSSHKAWGSANFFSSLFSLHYLDWFILNSLILSLSSPLYYWTHPWVLKFWLLYFWVL